MPLSKRWRPEGWENCHVPPILQSAFEEGAEAMLKSLKEKVSFMTPEQMEILAPDRKYPYGYLVFIPVEETEEKATLREATGILEALCPYYTHDASHQACLTCLSIHHSSLFVLSGRFTC